MAKPTKTPSWLTDVRAADTTVAVEATTDKKEAGWAAAEKVPAQGMNWWMWLVWKWIEWFNVGMEARTYRVPAAEGVEWATGSTGFFFYGGTLTAGRWQGQATTVATSGVAFPCRLEVGQTLAGFRAYVFGDNVAGISMYIRKTTRAGVVTIYGPGPFGSVMTTGAQVLTGPAGIPHTDQDFVDIIVSADFTDAANANLQIYGVEYDVVRA